MAEPPRRKTIAALSNDTLLDRLCVFGTQG